jgi:serine/threonine-protein kinase
MLCGRKPFIEDDHRSVMQKIRLERPTAVQRLNPDVPRELEKIINRCMEKRREDRFLSTQDLVSALERFLADRVEMNYHALLTYYLADQGVLSREELDAHVRPTLAGATKTTRTLAPHVDRSVRRLATWHGAILASMAILLGFVHATRLGAETRLEGSAPLGLGQSEGALRVLVDPWAEVWIDGKLLDTTPLSGPLTVPAGRHVLQLKNPYFVPDEREVTVEAGRIATVQTALRSAR